MNVRMPSNVQSLQQFRAANYYTCDYFATSLS